MPYMFNIFMIANTKDSVYCSVNAVITHGHYNLLSSLLPCHTIKMADNMI